MATDDPAVTRPAEAPGAPSTAEATDTDTGSQPPTATCGGAGTGGPRDRVASAGAAARRG